MASRRAKVVIVNEAFERLVKDPKLVEDIARRTKAIEDACNTQSEWGGYASSVSTEGKRVHGRVYSYGSHDDEARQNRMVRNLDAGR